MYRALRRGVRRVFYPLVRSILPSPVTTVLMNRFVYQHKINELGIKGDKIPLFDTVFFEVRTKCNGTCAFCAASIHNETRPDKKMSFDLYKKVITQLRDISFSGRVAYHVNNDPLIFDQLPEFVEFARANLPKAWIHILTNGKALTWDKAERLIKAGINILVINFYRKDISEQVPESIWRIRDELLPRYYRPDQIKSSPDRFEDYKDYEPNQIFIFDVILRTTNEVLTTRAGTSPNKKQMSKMPRGFCEYPFTQFNITADGRVSKCCADFYFSDPMGNVSERGILDIWHGERFNEVRRHLLRGDRRAIETCAKCDFYGARLDRSWPLISRLVHAITI